MQPDFLNKVFILGYKADFSLSKKINVPVCKTVFRVLGFSLPKNPKNLDPSPKMDLDFLELFWKASPKMDLDFLGLFWKASPKMD